MLYVFHVDTGTMMTFDINLALECVVSLKVMIEKVCRIPASSQVLLVSGGEVLRSEARVCSYSAGTDTNPIFMFSKTFTEYEPTISIGEYSADIDLKEQVENCMRMAPNYGTVVAYSQLAQQFWELAREHTHICEKLVHDQHLQQQGWAAVVANMEDVTCDFRERAEDFEQKFKEHLKKKDEYIDILLRFNEDLEKLSNIPILPALRFNAASNPFTAFDELHGDSESYSDKERDDESDKNNLIDSNKRNVEVTIIQTDNQGTIGSNDGSSKTSSLQGASGSTASEGDEGIESSREGQDSSTQLTTKSKPKSIKEAVTLLHWITAKENQESLKDIAKYCNKALELFTGNVISNLKTEVSEALAKACHEDMKRIKGLEERLCGLEQLMREARRIDQEQKDLAQSFMQNQQRAANLGDISVLKVLCESHCQQLQSMLRNDQRLRDIKGRCARAKEELATNLDHRLKWIVYVENMMFETDSRLMFYHRSLSRLKRHLAIIGQLHRAPRLFCTAVHEIVRRRTFSQAFLSWASELAGHLLTIHNEEVTRRRDFHNLFSGHFLSGLFPGTDDMPPAYGTQSPRSFDTELPKLTQSDIDTLSSRMPQLTPELPTCDMTPIINFFQSRSMNEEKNLERVPVDDRLAALRETGLDRGFESETDTEEFEKVGPSPLDHRILGTAGSTCAVAVKTDATTLTEENIGSQISEVESLREKLSSLNNLCSQSITLIRDELGKLKSDAVDNNHYLKHQCNSILSAWDKHIIESSQREREAFQRLTVDHELEMNDVKAMLSSKEDEIHTLTVDIKESEHKCSKRIEEMNSKIANLEKVISKYKESEVENQKRIDEIKLVNEKALKDLQTKMAQEHKTEVESLRSRFRYVSLTSMDRSPSESSLEKIERPDMIEISSHKAIVSQTKEDMELEKEEAIKAALETQEKEWRSKYEELEKSKSKQTDPAPLSDTVKRIIEEKERQLDLSRERENNLLRECMKYKETIQQLTDPETSDHPSSALLQAQIQTLREEKEALEQKLTKLNTRKDPQTESVRLIDSSTSPDPRYRLKIWKMLQPYGIAPGTFTTMSCDVGDTVVIAWDETSSNYCILQEFTAGAIQKYLVHTDSLAVMKLDLKKIPYTLGVVEYRDHCIAAKFPNRYNVPIGVHFYQVKVKPKEGKKFICDHSSKLKESSQKRNIDMSGSVVISSSSTKTQPKEPMSKSVWTILSDSQTPSTSTSMYAKKSEEIVTVQESVSRQNSIEFRPEPSSIESPLSPMQQSTECATSSSASNLEQSVPYQGSDKEFVSDNVSTEQLVSEVAEEAAP